MSNANPNPVTIENDIRDVIRRANRPENNVPLPPVKQVTDFAPERVRGETLTVTPPSYVDADPEASKVARLSGAAAATEYEKAAVSIEQHGEQLKAELEKTMLHIAETAELFRKEAASLYRHIEATTTRAAKVLKQSEEFRAALNAPPATAPWPAPDAPDKPSAD